MTTVIILAAIAVPCAFAFGWAVGHDVGKTDGYAEAEEKRERESTPEKSSVVGNAAKMREALSGIDEFMTRTIYRAHGEDIERWRKALEGASDAR